MTEKYDRKAECVRCILAFNDIFPDLQQFPAFVRFAFTDGGWGSFFINPSKEWAALERWTNREVKTFRREHDFNSEDIQKAAERLNWVLDGYVVAATDVDHEKRFIDQLFRVAGIEPSFELRDFEAVLAADLAENGVLGQTEINERRQYLDAALNQVDPRSWGSEYPATKAAAVYHGMFDDEYLQTVEMLMCGENPYAAEDARDAEIAEYLLSQVAKP